MPDVNLLSDSISAIERRPEAISNELRREVMASRHDKRQDMTNRITKLPAGVSGSAAASLVSHSGSTHGETRAFNVTDPC